ncbi:hypothetical protein KC19_10G111000 [Ceratodon purpureus]|uniref:ELMO domain-containing protein n=1 Tax=Ceratodon purpureus TaxID=3225 RepID=A0A8T0GKH4_CERPU|nr:hypothetical protein KC19_10G111000 [Ceratodon purpureus]
MNSAGALRRRVHHESGGKYGQEESSTVESLNEPLLRQRSSDDDDDPEWKKREQIVWTHNVSRLLAQWAQWFSTVVLAGGFRVGSNLFMAVLGRQLNGTSKPEDCLSPVVVGRLEKLQQRLAIPFDGSLPEHQDALKALWQASFPERAMPGLVSPQWKDMGWQGNDPGTDFRGGGFISLENLLFFARRFPLVFQNLLHKEEGKRAEWEYPFAVAGINITFMLIQLLDLRAAKPSSPSVASFFNMLASDEDSFDLLYCVAFKLLDAQWLAQGASYMEFNAVLQATRKQLEKELALEDVDRVEDLPSYITLDL